MRLSNHSLLLIISVSFLASIAAYERATLTSVFFKDGYSLRISSSLILSAKQSKITETITRVPLIQTLLFLIDNLVFTKFFQLLTIQNHTLSLLNNGIVIIYQRVWLSFRLCNLFLLLRLN